MKIIYKLMLPAPDSRVYFGSSRSFKAMLLQHKSPCSNPNDPHYNNALYTAIRAVGTWDDVKAVKIMYHVEDVHVKKILKHLIDSNNSSDPKYGLNYKRGK